MTTRRSTGTSTPTVVFTVKWLPWHLSAPFCPSRSVLCPEPSPPVNGCRAGSQTPLLQVSPSHQTSVARMWQGISVSGVMLKKHISSHPVRAEGTLEIIKPHPLFFTNENCIPERFSPFPKVTQQACWQTTAENSISYPCHFPVAKCCCVQFLIHGLLRAFSWNHVSKSGAVL